MPKKMNIIIFFAIISQQIEEYQEYNAIIQKERKEIKIITI